MPVPYSTLPREEDRLKPTVQTQPLVAVAQPPYQPFLDREQTASTRQPAFIDQTRYRDSSSPDAEFYAADVKQWRDNATASDVERKAERLKSSATDAEKRVTENVSSVEQVKNTVGQAYNDGKDAFNSKLEKISKTAEPYTRNVPSAQEAKETVQNRYADVKARAIDAGTQFTEKMPATSDIKKSASDLQSTVYKNCADLKTVASENISVLQRKGAEASRAISRNSPYSWIALGLLLPLLLLPSYAAYSFMTGGSRHPRTTVSPDRSFGYSHGAKVPAFKSEFHVLDVLRNAGFAQRFSTLDRMNDRDGWLLQVDVPGFQINEISMDFSGPILKIRGVRSCEKNNDGESKDSTCVERFLKEEIRFPDEANMDSSSARLSNGVLYVQVKPNHGYSTSSRPIRIVEHIGNSVKSMFSSNSGNAVSSGQSSANSWTGTNMEDAIRRSVSKSLDAATTSLRIPADKQADFMNAIQGNLDSMTDAIRQHTIAPYDVADNVYQLAQDTWGKMKATAVDGKDTAVDGTNDAFENIKSTANWMKDGAQAAAYSVKDGAQAAANSAMDGAQAAANLAMDGAQDAANSVRGGAQVAADSVYDTAKAASDSVYDTAKAAADTVQGAAGAMGEQAFAFASDAQQKATYAQQFAYENAQNFQNRGEEAFVRAQHRVKENIKYATDKAAETSQYATDRAAENALYLKNRVEEATGLKDKTNTASGQFQQTYQKVKVALGAEEKKDDGLVARLKHMMGK